MATKKQSAPQEDVATHQALAESAELVGDGTGEALPEISQDEIDAAAVPAAPEPPAEPDPSLEASVETSTVRVLCTTTLGANRYQPNNVIEGVPADVLSQYAGSLDPHPDAIAFAKAEGGPTLQYEA